MVKKHSFSDISFDIVNRLFMIFCTLVVVYPIIYIVSSSFSSANAIIAGKVWLLPVEPSIKAYQAVFRNKQVVTGYTNSIIYTAGGTLISVFLTIAAAYPLSRKFLPGRKFFTAMFVFTMLFSGGLIPTYFVVRNVGLIDTRWAIILPNALSVWNLMVTLTYFKTSISEEMFEAAIIEGASDFRILQAIVLPLSQAIIAVIALYYAIGIWNSYFDALIYLKSSSKFPLQIILRNILIINQSDLSMGADMVAMARRQGMADVMKYALIVISSAPLLMIYPFVQKHFVKGVMLGSIKG
ncbi:carbohydrate ABC transporter permease [Sphaerochaeta sp. PS]|uniref:carbohydrate ABC transporter permease n=1 Tax=Sphaerochaeta sp. PS TaxID=3076336 RepID=UPI0028A5562F|nr:carbohydrate ABC transporter permease [Sphaerochaeta sp. PS]MDT4761050.1 carbohydrate ABC transporter permease [Sphaerochaeta sp. PS]